MRGNTLRCIEKTFRNPDHGLWKRYDFYEVASEENILVFRWFIQKENALSLMVSSSEKVAFSDIGSDGSYEWLDLDSQDASGEKPRYELFDIRDPWDIKLAAEKQRSAFSKNEVEFLGGEFGSPFSDEICDHAAGPSSK